MFVETAEESQEQLNIQQLRLALEEREMETKALYVVNEKIMAATDEEHIEEEMVTTRKEGIVQALTDPTLRKLHLILQVITGYYSASQELK